MRTPNLADALNQSARPTPVAETNTPPSAESNTRKKRDGKRMIGGHFERDVHRQLKQLSLDRDCTVQELLAKSLNLLFESEGLPPIAETQERKT